MIIHVWSVLCASATINEETNNFSLHEVLEQVNVDQGTPPATAPLKFELVTLWSRSDLSRQEVGMARWFMESPSGKKSNASEMDLDLSTYHRLRVRTRFEAIPIDAPGCYWFVVELRQEASKWTQAVRIPLEVRIGPPG